MTVAPGRTSALAERRSISEKASSPGFVCKMSRWEWKKRIGEVAVCPHTARVVGAEDVHHHALKQL